MSVTMIEMTITAKEMFCSLLAEYLSHELYRLRPLLIIWYFELKYYRHFLRTLYI